MFRAGELYEWLQGSRLQILALSASDCLATFWGAKLSSTWNDPEKWHELLRMEVEACGERESWNMGMHTTAVVKKREENDLDEF